MRKIFRLSRHVGHIGSIPSMPGFIFAGVGATALWTFIDAQPFGPPPNKGEFVKMGQTNEYIIDIKVDEKDI